MNHMQYNANNWQEPMDTTYIFHVEEGRKIRLFHPHKEDKNTAQKKIRKLKETQLDNNTSFKMKKTKRKEH